jgi:hypothetical protein
MRQKWAAPVMILCLACCDAPAHGFACAARCDRPLVSHTHARRATPALLSQVPAPSRCRAPAPGLVLPTPPALPGPGARALSRRHAAAHGRPLVRRGPHGPRSPPACAQVRCDSRFGFHD